MDLDLTKRRGHRRRGLWAAAAGALLLAVLVAGAVGLSSRGKAAPDQLVPLYSAPGPSLWATACSEVNGAHGGSFLVADIGAKQGPGPSRVAAWASVFHTCAGYGKASVLGYVWTDYGQGGMASVPGIEAQVADWYSYYPGDIAGIFFDGASDTVPGATTPNVTFYRTLASYVHSKEGSHSKVVLNFGTNPTSGWMFAATAAENADIVVTFEGSYNTPGENPYTSWAPASWESHYPAHDFAAIVYDEDNATDAALSQPSTACKALRKENLGYLYAGTTYTDLPPEFTQMVADC